MAGGYIGKISALVTASTADLERKLVGATGTVKAFGRSLSTTIVGASKSAENSLGGIFTPLQRLQRALTVGSGRLKLIDPSTVARVQRTFQIAEDINKPLGAAAKQFSTLSRAVAAEFQPALVRAQNQVLFVNKQIQEFGVLSDGSFKKAARTVDQTTAAIKRLGEAQAIISSGPRGDELAFRAPRVSQSLRSSAAIRSQAAQLPASALDSGRVADQVANLSNVENRIAQIQARIESLRARPQVDTSQIKAAEQELAKYLTASDRIQASIKVTVDAEKAKADLDAVNKKKAEAASKALVIDTQTTAELDRQNARGASSTLTGRRNPMQRGISSLQGEVSSLRNRLESLDEPLRASLGPAVDVITNKFRLLARAGVAVSADEVNRLKSEVNSLNSALDSRASISSDFGTQFGGAGREGLSLGVDSRSLNAVGREIEFVQSQLSGLAAEARGPTIRALEALRSKARDLFSKGAIDTKQGRAELEALRVQLVKTLSAASGQSEKQIARSLKRIGDAARGAFSKTGLAVQQAVFGFEDFFSVTGDLDQRVRAAGNNLTQLGVILGGTEGLILAVAAAVGAQLLIAFYKMETGGLKAADKTRALNDTLAETKSTAEELRRTFEAVSSTFTDNAFSKANRDILLFNEAVADLEKKLREARNQRVTLLFTVNNRARQAQVERELNEASDPVQQAILLRRQRGLAALQKILGREAEAQRPPSVEDIQKNILEAASILISTAARNADPLNQIVGPPGGANSLSAERGRELETLSGQLPQGNDINGIREQLRVLRDAEAYLAAEAERAASEWYLNWLGAGGRIGDVGENLMRLSKDIALLEREFSAALDSQALEAVRKIGTTALRLSDSIEILSDAVDSTANSFVDANALEDISFLEGYQALLRDARRRLEEAAAMEPGPEREAAQARAQADIDSAEDVSARALVGVRDAQRRKAVREGASVSDLRRMDARMRLREIDQNYAEFQVRDTAEWEARNEKIREASRQTAAAREELGKVTALNKERAAQGLAPVDDARQRKALDEAKAREAALRRERDAAAEEQTRRARELFDATNVANAAQSVVFSLTTFSEAIDRVSTQLVDAVTKEARQIADDARRNAIRAKAMVDLGGSQEDADFAVRQRRRAELEARNAERRKEEVDRQNQAAKDEFERKAAAGQLDKESQALIAERDRLDKILAGDIGATDEERIAARRRREEIDRELARRFEDSPEGRQAAARADAATQEAERDRLREESVVRGRELMRSPAEQAGRQLAQDIRDIDAAAKEAAVFAFEGFDFRAVRDANAKAEEARRRVIDEAFRQAAPAIAALADNVANAVLGGPSRAALNVTDVSTVQGAQELNRLLRGDDSARDQNLVELRNQSKYLEELVQIARDGGVAIANN